MSVLKITGIKILRAQSYYNYDIKCRLFPSEEIRAILSQGKDTFLRKCFSYDVNSVISLWYHEMVNTVKVYHFCFVGFNLFYFLS